MLAKVVSVIGEGWWGRQRDHDKKGHRLLAGNDTDDSSANVSGDDSMLSEGGSSQLYRHHAHNIIIGNKMVM